MSGHHVKTDTPYDYLPGEVIVELESAFQELPEVQRQFESGQPAQINQSLKTLRDAGWLGLAGRIEVRLPYKYSL